MHSLQSSIASVTVFSDRAQIIRRAKSSFKSGTHNIEFSGLPRGIDEQSIQLAGKGNVLIKAVNFATRNLKTESSEKLNELLAQKEGVEDKLAEITDEVKRLEGQKDFVKAIAGRITAPVERANSDELSPESWQGMLSFQMEHLERIDKEIRETAQNNRKLNEELDWINREIRQIRQASSKTERVVSAELELDQDAEVELLLSYLVHGASWEPVYDLRVDTNDKAIMLSYQGLVRQSTGEDWSGIRLSLSTAKPHIHGNPPEILPHFLRKFVPPPPMPKPMVRSAKKMSKKASRSMMESAVAEPMAEAEFDDVMYGARANRSTSTVKEQSASVVFEVNDTTDIPSGKDPHQVMILQTKLSGKFTHSSVPSLSPFAFLQADVTNDSEFPLLAGNANIYMDGHYISKSSLKFIAPGEDFEISLGVDEAVKVEYKIVGKFRKSEGFIGPKKEKQVFNNLITVTNRKSISIKIEIKDKYPISQDNDIKVELIKPRYEADTEALKKDEQNILTFNKEIAAGEKWEIPVEYQVVYPKDLKVDGI